MPKPTTLAVLAGSLVASLSGSLCAQSSSTFTSPHGYDSKEGALAHGYVLGSEVELTWQQIDSTLRGKTLSMKSIAFRRDGSMPSNPEFKARSLELEVWLANSDLTKISTTHAQNYVGVPTQVVKQKTVSAPSWVTQPASTPAKFDFKLPFETSWTYEGEHDFLWEFRVEKNSYVSGGGTAFTNYPFDFEYVAPDSSFFNGATASKSTILGTGCTASGMSAAFSLSSTIHDYGIKYLLVHSALNAPASSPVVTYFGLEDPDLLLRGWCTKLHCTPLFSLSMGTSSSTGTVSPKTVDNIPHSQGIAGLSIYLQAFSLDSGFINETVPRVSLSHGLELVVAESPDFPKVGRVYTHLYKGQPFTSGPWTGGIIAQFEK